MSEQECHCVDCLPSCVGDCECQEMKSFQKLYGYKINQVFVYISHYLHKYMARKTRKVAKRRKTANTSFGGGSVPAPST